MNLGAVLLSRTQRLNGRMNSSTWSEEDLWTSLRDFTRVLGFYGFYPIHIYIYMGSMTHTHTL